MNQPFADFQKKVVLITGAAQRIGAEIARTLHQQGASIVIHYRHSSGAAEQLNDELNQQRSNSSAIAQADLINIDNHAQLIETCVQHFGRLDVLVNNASTFYPTPVGAITLADWEDLLGSNLKAPLFLSQTATPQLKKNRGCIINIVDIHAERPLKEHTVYCAAKAGLVMLTKSLARELAPDIRVNGVAPGAILWPEQSMGDETKASILSRIALKRQGQPTEIAKAVAFLASDASYTTGQILNVDGGRSLYC